MIFFEGKIRRLICVFIATLFFVTFFEAHSFAEVPKRFRIRDVSGRVLAWKPWSHVWETVESDELVWEHTLIQVGKNSSFTFALDADEGFRGMKAESVEYTINVPMVLRLESGIPRKVTLDDFFIPELPDVTKAKGSKEHLLYHTFSEAWKRFAANVLVQAIKKKFLKQAEDEKVETSTAVRAQRLKIYHPSDNAISITDEMPYLFRLAWQKVPERGASYGVRVWEADQMRPKPVGYTKQDYYSVKINKEGTYLVQVMTKDERYQSEVRRVNIVLPMSGRGKPPSKDKVIKPLPLEHPPKNFVYLTRKFPVSVTFVWGKPNSIKGQQIYEYVLADPNRNPLFERRTSEHSITIKFNEPGKYKWYLTSYPQQVEDEKKDKPVFSEMRSFSIDKYIPGRSRRNISARDPLEALIATKARRVFYLSEGL